MAILVNKSTRVIIQGITGSSGTQAASELLDYETRLVAGVTPGKGGQEVEGVPVFNSVKEAIEAVGEVDGTVQFVSPLFVKGAVKEAIEAGLKFILISAEKVPTSDEAYMYALAQENGA